MDIRNYKQNSLVSGSEGNDYISNGGMNVTINGGAGNDTIHNSSASVSIDGGNDNDSITNTNTNVTISGGAGNDSISLGSFSKNNLIQYKEGDGNDVIYGFKYNSTLDLGGGEYYSTKSGNDIIVTVGKNKITLSRAANLYKVNILGSLVSSPLSLVNGQKNAVSLIGGSNNDTIINKIGSYVTIDGGAGNDRIENNSGFYSKIFGGAGADKVTNGGSYSTIDGGDGADSISNNGNYATITSGAGRDRIINNGKSSAIDGGEGDDSISNNGDYATITSGAGNDYIYNRGEAVSITGGAGDDSIRLDLYSRNSLIEYASGDGNDVIYGFKENSTLRIADGNYSTTKSGSDVIVTVGDSKITLQGAASLSKVNIIKVSGGNLDEPVSISNNDANLSLVGGNNDDTIINSGINVTIAGNDGSDSISNSGEAVSISGGEGNDFIESKGSMDSINAGESDDTIKNSGTDAKIEGGAGNDTISNSKDGINVTLEGGEGNDVLENNADNVIFLYNEGDGNDVIRGFSENSSLKLGEGINAATTKSGNDIIVTLGENKVTLQGAATLSTVNIVEAPVNINNKVRRQNINTNNGDDTINNSGAQVTINARGGNDSIDNKGNYSSIDSGAGNDYIHNYGLGAIIISGKGDDSVETENNAGLRYNEGDGNDILYGFRYGSRLFIAEGKYYSQVKGDDVVITVGSGGQITLDGAAVMSGPIITNSPVSIRSGRNEMIVGTDANEFISGANYATIQANGGDDTIDNGSERASIDGGNGNDSIANSGYLTTIDGGAGNDYISNISGVALIDGGDGNDRIFDGSYAVYGTLTIIGGKGDDSIEIRNDHQVSFQYKEGDGNDTIYGFKSNSTLDLGGGEYSSVKSGSDIIVTVGEEKITLKGAAALKTVHVNGVINQPLEIDNKDDDISVFGSSYGDTITNSGKDVTIDARSGSDSISNSADSVTIDGGTGNDIVTNSGSQVSILGGAGADTISNSGSNVSITGGANNDRITNNGSNVTIEGGARYDVIEIGANGNNALIKYKAGDDNDVITGFKANSTLLISGGVPADTKTLGNDIIVTVGDNTITLQGAANLSTVNIVETPVNIHNSARKRFFSGANANDTIINTGEKATLQGLKGNDSINNNAAYVSIDGGEGDDNISNIGRSSTLVGNSGNDTIYNNAARGLVFGSEDNDSIFNHGEGSTILGEGGNDTIENYTNSNRVSIAAGEGDDSIKNAGHNVTIEGGEGNDTVVSNTGTAVSITGGEGGDFISIKGSYKNTIVGGLGNDTISLDWGSNNALIQYNLGDGNDVIEGINSTSTLKIGDGNDTYAKEIEGDDIILTVGEENLTLKGAAKLARFTIAGVTQLKVNNIINAVSLIGDRLDDSIVNSGHKVTISAVAGNDTIENTGRYVSISGGADNDNISDSNGTFVTIDGAGGDDTITATNSNFASVDGGEGNDVISVSGGVRNAISGGIGDDSIYVAESEDILIKHGTGDGNDYITGFNENSTLQIGSETDTYTKTILDGNFIVTVGEEKITLAGAENLATVNIIGTEVIAGNNISNSDENVVLNGNAGNDTINNSAQNVTIKGNAGNDSINNSSGNVSIDGGDDNDSISNSGTNVTINGGAGADTIDNRGDNAKIVGGAYADSIYNTGDNATISGKAGDDSITNNYGSNVVFDYVSGDGNDVITGFDEYSTLNISGLDYATERSGNDVIVSVGGGTITIKDAALLARHNKLNIAHVSKEFPQDIANTDEEISVVGTSFDDTISNKGEYVTITAQGGNDTITNAANNTTIDGGEGDDTIVNDYAFYSSIAGGEGSDVISVASSSQVTINAGKADDTINLSKSNETFIEYNAGDGNDLITGFDEYSTLNIAKTEFTSATTDSGDIVITVGDEKITLEGAATLSNPHIVSGTYATFTIKNSAVTCDTDIPESIIKAAYQFDATNSLLTLNDSLKDKIVAVKADADAKVNWHYGTATLSSDSTLKYQLADGENTATLTSKSYDDEITFSEKTMFNYGRIQAEVQENSTVSTKAANRISFENNSSASVTARRDYIIDVAESNITVNDLPVNAQNGAGTVTVERNGLSFEGYGAQFADLEIAKESYFGKLAPMKVTYDSREEIYTVYNAACVKTLSNDFTKLKFDFKTGTEDSTSSDENYAYYKINDVAILTTKDEDDTSVVEVNDRTFKVEDKELDAEKIGRITLDDKITFSGTGIKYDGVETNYTQNKPIIYSEDGNEITINDAATVTTGEETKTFTCAAGSYVINRRSFETTTDLTFTADANEIKIPLTDAKTEIYFDGVKVSGIGGGGEIVFDLANDKISIPDGATINITSPDEIKLNLAAGNFTIAGKKISINTELEITADKDKIKVPLSENAVTINGAAIIGTGAATIDSTEEIFCSVLLPDGALVQNASDNTFSLNGQNSAAYFGDANKKVQMTSDGTAYISFDKANEIGVGFNALMFEQVEIQGNNAWTVETSGTSGIDKITGIKSGATITTSTEYVDTGGLRFEVETNGAGDFTICGQKITATDKNTYVVSGNSNGEIKVAPQGEEYSGDDSEAAGKTYQYNNAGDYTVNGITFHAEANSKVQTITRGVEFDLSTGKFQYDGLTLDGKGSAQINRYNASLISLTDGAKVSGNDKSKYQNRQFAINGAVEIIGKKFETDQQIRCGLINIQTTIEGTSVTLNGFVVDDKYVGIEDDFYNGVKIVDGKITNIEGVKASAKISGNGLASVSIAATESGEFTINGKTYKISGDSDGVTFVTDSHGNVSEINGLAGSVEGNFENAVSINGKAIRLSGASSVKVSSDGTNITEISNVAGDSDGSYRKNVRVYELGGAEKLTTSADGMIIFNGNKFETSAGKTFNLDSSGNVSEINNTTKVLAAYATAFDTVEENIATIDLTTTDNLDEVIGDFSEGLTVNGVFVHVTDSTNFVVKDDSENVYIETTAPDTFTINSKTFETYADKTIFKLDADGNVSEIVTDKFYLYPDEDVYLIVGDFNDEIIFNGKKFCVTGTNDTSIFLDDETLIGVELARNAVEVAESGGASEIAVSGGGEITVGGKTFSTADDFVGTLQTNSDGVHSAENFIGTLSGKLGGLELAGLTINSGDSFSVTGDGEKVIAIENLVNGTFTSGDLNGLAINGEKLSFDNSGTITIIDGKLKSAAETVDSGTIAEEILSLEDASVVSGKENLTLSGGEALIVEDSASKVNITASKGEDTIYTAGKRVDIDLKSGGATKIYAAEGKVTVENYNAKSGAAFLTENENIAEAIEENSITYDDGKLTVNSAQVTFADDADSRIINFVDTDDDTQKVGFVSNDSKLDASKESGNLILVGASNSTLTGGKGKNQIYLEENSDATILLNGRNTIENFNATFDYGDKISVDATNYKFSYDGEKISVKSGTARALLENITSDSARILTIINGKETKTAIAQAGAVMSMDDDLADVYYGKKSGVDFASYDELLTLDLSKNFYGINKVTVGGGLNTLISSSANETLTGNSNGITEFNFRAGGGRDLIQNFNFDEDKINIGTDAVTDVRITKAGNVRLKVGVGDDYLTLEDAQGKNFKINDVVALVDKNITYDEAANYFVATSRNASVTVNDSAEIWLDGSHGKIFAGDIRTLDATTSEGKNTLAGNDLDNTICAGNSDASLWGGAGNDLLVGGSGENTFFYTSGNDTIQGANDDDEIILSGVTLEQISGTNFTVSGVAINFKDGYSLTIESRADVTYQLQDGSKFSADHEQSAWLTK